MYCYYDGDEERAVSVIEKHVEEGRLPELAGYVLTTIVLLEEGGEE